MKTVEMTAVDETMPEVGLGRTWTGGSALRFAYRVLEYMGQYGNLNYFEGIGRREEQRVKYIQSASQLLVKVSTSSRWIAYGAIWPGIEFLATPSPLARTKSKKQKTIPLNELYNGDHKTLGLGLVVFSLGLESRGWSWGSELMEQRLAPCSNLTH